MNRLPPGRRTAPPQQRPTTQGTVERMPCPHCGKPNDFRELDNQQCLDTGHKMSCDWCHHRMEITMIRVVKFVQARPIDGVAVPALGAAQATTISPSQLRNLLK